jgi:predicted ATPase
MYFEADMIVPEEGEDDSGQVAKTTIRLLRYKLGIKQSNSPETGGLQIYEESLDAIQPETAIRFPYKSEWLESFFRKGRSQPYISTVKDGDAILIQRHTDVKEGGHIRKHRAERLLRTVLSSADAFESPTALMARREMQGWKMLHLEPSALRAPDDLNGIQKMDERGAHLPGVLFRLSKIRLGETQSAETEEMYLKVANKLKELLEDVKGIEVDVDTVREILSLVLTDRRGTKHFARDLSDGTLRFLALTLLYFDPASPRLICLEEPENGLHPKRISAIIQLLLDLSVDSATKIDDGNLLRQVIINTHSPEVASNVPEDTLILASTNVIQLQSGWWHNSIFKGLTGTWRVSPEMERDNAVNIGTLFQQLGLKNQSEPTNGVQLVRHRPEVRDRQKEIQISLFEQSKSR